MESNDFNDTVQYQLGLSWIRFKKETSKQKYPKKTLLSDLIEKMIVSGEKILTHGSARHTNTIKLGASLFAEKSLL